MESRWRVMGENSSLSNSSTTMKTSCRAVVNADNRHGHSNKVSSKSSPISYFLNVSITTNKSRAVNESNPKFRIKIPKVLAKTVKKKELQYQTNGTTSTIKPGEHVKTTKWTNAKMLLHVNKVTSLFSSLKKPGFSDRRESVSSNNSCNIRRNIEDGQHQNSFTDEYGIEDDDDDEEEEENKGILNKISIGQLEDSDADSDSAESSASFKSVASFKSMTSSLFSLNINEDYGYVSEPNSPPLPDSIHHPKENLKTNEKEEYDEDPIGFNGTRGSTFKLPSKASSFKTFLNKKTAHLSFITKGSTSTSTSGSNNSISRSEVGGDEEIKGQDEEEMCRKSSANDQKRTWKNSITGMKVVNRKKKTESDDKELWKKRILMGEKCRPLSISEFIEPPPPHSPR